MTSDDEQALRKIADEITQLRDVFWDNLMAKLNKEVDDIAAEHDPAAGQGRGPWWANGD